MLRQGILWLRSRARTSRQIKPMLSLLFHLLTFPFDLKCSLANSATFGLHVFGFHPWHGSELNEKLEFMICVV